MPNMKNFKASRILELNPDHAIFNVLQDAFNNNKEDDLKELSQILYYQSLLSEGLKIEDPFDFVQKINSLIIKTKA